MSMCVLAAIPLIEALARTVLVLVGLLGVVGWVFWRINPPRF